MDRSRSDPVFSIDAIAGGIVSTATPVKPFGTHFIERHSKPCGNGTAGSILCSCQDRYGGPVEFAEGGVDECSPALCDQSLSASLFEEPITEVALFTQNDVRYAGRANDASPQFDRSAEPIACSEQGIDRSISRWRSLTDFMPAIEPIMNSSSCSASSRG